MSTTEEHEIPHFSQRERDTLALITELFPQTQLPLAEVSVMDDEKGVLSKGYRIILTPEPESQRHNLSYTIDLDDTLVDYKGAKAKFHQQAEKILSATSALKKVDQTLVPSLLPYINKAARVLPESKVHPECYLPTLEICSIVQLANLLQEDDFQKDLSRFKQLAATAKEGDKEAELQANNWVRRRIISPTVQGKRAIFPLTALELYKEEGKNKLYFRRTGQEKKTLATCINEDEVTHYSDTKNLTFQNQDQKKLFRDLYDVYQQTMLSPAINRSLIPPLELSLKLEGRMVLATFGEDRFQLEKTRQFLQRLKEQGLREPDEIIFFEQGRKAPLLKVIYERNKKSNPNYQQIHLDNSQRQCEEIERLAISDMKAILVKPEKLTHSFIDLVQ